MIKTANEFVFAAQQACKGIDAAGAKRLLEQSAAATIIDVREPSEAG